MVFRCGSKNPRSIVVENVRSSQDTANRIRRTPNYEKGRSCLWRTINSEVPCLTEFIYGQPSNSSVNFQRLLFSANIYIYSYFQDDKKRGNYTLTLIFYFLFREQNIRAYHNSLIEWLGNLFLIYRVLLRACIV